MRSFIVLVFALVLSLSVFGTVAPFHKYEDDRFNAVEDRVTDLETDFVGSYNEITKVFTVTLPATDQASDTGYDIPGDSYVTFSALTIDATSAETALSFGCTEAATDMLNESDISTKVANDAVAGTQTGAVSTWEHLDDDCDLKIKTPNDVTAVGIVKLIIKYIVQ